MIRYLLFLSNIGMISFGRIISIRRILAVVIALISIGIMGVSIITCL